MWVENVILEWRTSKMNAETIAAQIEKTRQAARPAVGLMDELLAIQSGACIWCSKKLVHPAHSRCKHNASFRNVVSMSGMKVA
jgi:hypothetical protein